MTEMCVESWIAPLETIRPRSFKLARGIPTKVAVAAWDALAGGLRQSARAPLPSPIPRRAAVCRHRGPANTRAYRAEMTGYLNRGRSAEVMYSVYGILL